MEFNQAMRAWKRMCDASPSCMKCPMKAYNGSDCLSQVFCDPGKYEDVIAKWSAEHPEKTPLEEGYHD